MIPFLPQRGFIIVDEALALFAPYHIVSSSAFIAAVEVLVQDHPRFAPGLLVQGNVAPSFIEGEVEIVESVFEFTLGWLVENGDSFRLVLEAARWCSPLDDFPAFLGKGPGVVALLLALVVGPPLVLVDLGGGFEMPLEVLTVHVCWRLLDGFDDSLNGEHM